MKIEINKKLLLGTALLSAGFAFGNYVSIVDAKSNGGVAVVTPSFSEQDIRDLIKDEFGNKFPIGSITMRMDSVNPSTLYGGTWELIDEDATITFGNGNSQTGIPVGDNNPLVPLPAHSHNYSMPSMGYAGIVPGNQTRRLGDSGSEGVVYYGTSATGVSDARLDVRGARVAINVWKRIN